MRAASAMCSAMMRAPTSRRARMTGTQLAESIKAEWPAQPILMLTGFTDPALNRREQPAGVDLMLTKPIPQKELRDALAQLCPS